MSKEKELIEKEDVRNVETSGVPIETPSGLRGVEEFHEEEHDEDNDLSGHSKEELLQLLESLKVEDQLSKSSNLLKQIKSHFDGIVELEKQEALHKFVESGGEEGDFEFRRDKTAQKFDKVYDSIREKISNQYGELEREKEKNLRVKNELLEKLRSLISQEETHSSLTAFKEIQEEWKKTGPVNPAKNQELWANYNALVERFYNNRSIYFELKELDRKKNFEAKKDICEKAEELVNSNQAINVLIREIKSLHEEFRNIGPVPKEDQEQLWNRFKLASDKIYDKRNEHFKNLKDKHEENLKKKSDLAERISSYSSFDTERIEDWKTKTAEVLALQDEWKKVGGLPPEKAKEVSKRFWGACKAFFHNKELFFKKLEVEKQENLKKKVNLCERAEAAKDNEDMNETSNYLKDLQKEWESIGPVPIKEKESIYKRFKAACDHFFNRKRETQAESEKEFVENQKKKEALIARIEGLVQEKKTNADELKSIQDEWKSIGFVPKNKVKEVNTRYSKAVEDFLNSLSGGDENLRLSLEIGAMRTSPDGGKKLFNKEKELQKKIQGLKQEIDRLNTNMEFFAKSATADKLKQEIVSKIQTAQKEVDSLTKQLKMVKAAE